MLFCVSFLYDELQDATVAVLKTSKLRNLGRHFLSGSES